MAGSDGIILMIQYCINMTFRWRFRDAADSTQTKGGKAPSPGLFRLSQILLIDFCQVLLDNLRRQGEVTVLDRYLLALL